MAAQIISLVQRLRHQPRDWSSQELAEFYRVESALLQAGLRLESERGMSDEGDPWFCFCREDSGEVFIHFARVDGVYVVDGAAFAAPAHGPDFGALVRDLISRHPLAATRQSGSNVFLHPAALLIALVGAAFFHSGQAKAGDLDGAGAAAGPGRAEPRRGFVFNAGGAAPAADTGAGRTVVLDGEQVAAVLAGVAIGLRQVAQSTTSVAPGWEPSPAAPTPAAFAHGSPAPVALASGPALGRGSVLSDAEVRAALTVMAVLHDLAPVAVPVVGAEPAPADTRVDTTARPLPSLAEAAPPAPSPAGDGGGAAAAQAARPAVAVQLVEGPLPTVAAVLLVVADGALAHIAPEHVLHVDALPAVLADLIVHGDIADASAPPSAVPTPPTLEPPTAHAPGPVTGPTPPAPAPAAPPAVVEAPAPAAGEHDTSAVAPPVQTAPAPAPPSPPPGHNPAIDAAILSFVTHVAGVMVMVTDHELVFYDPQILGVLGPGETVDSVTWRLEDGSSVSLVGTAPELHGFHDIG